LEVLLLDVVQTDRTEMTKLLVENMENLNAGDGLGKTALHKAVERRSVENVRVLVNAGADVNVLSKLGRSPLDYAAWGKTAAPGVVEEIVEILLAKDGKSGAELKKAAGRK
jgi:ankyrin repeat protein